MNPEKDLLKILEEFSKKLPKFPDGRINYTNSDYAPIMSIFVKYKDEVLLLKRSDKVNVYKGKWNSLTGYLDKPNFIEQIAEEAEEELDLGEEYFSKLLFGDSYEIIDSKINKKFIIFPVLLELKEKPEIKLNWENTDYRWIKPEELNDFDIIPDVEEGLKRAIASKQYE